MIPKRLSEYRVFRTSMNGETYLKQHTMNAYVRSAASSDVRTTITKGVRSTLGEELLLVS